MTHRLMVQTKPELNKKPRPSINSTTSHPTDSTHPKATAQRQTTARVTPCEFPFFDIFLSFLPESSSRNKLIYFLHSFLSPPLDVPGKSETRTRKHSMAESPCHTASPEPAQAAASSFDADATQYWCYHCEKSVSIETLPSLPDVICRECKNGFVESIPPSSLLPPSLTPDHADDPSFGSQFLQVLSLIAEAAHDEDAPQQQASGTETEGDFLRIELDGWDNDDDGDGDDDDDDGEEENGGEDETEEGEDRSDNDDEENGDSDYLEYLRRRRRDLLRLRLREFAMRAGTRGNRILDWAEILMGLEDNSIEFRLEVQESDRYVGNPEDYVDAAGYEALLQNLAENDGGRRGAPPAAKAAVLELPTVEMSSEQEAIVCAICKDVINLGETATKIPCGHGYHGECIVPWLGSRNTCPVCRFELPTDDPEYEEERKKRVSLPPSVGGASGSSGENSSSG